MEQASNAAALNLLGYGQMMQTVDARRIEPWLYETKALRVTYPNTAKYLVEWIKNGMPSLQQSWYDQLWSEVTVSPIELH